MSRRGLVLGAGGVLGFAWAVGALSALEAAEGIDCRDADMIVGTSAGSITAALLGCGVAVPTMLAHQSGIPVEGDTDAADTDAGTSVVGSSEIDYDYETDSGGSLPPWPAPGLGSAQLLVHAALHPRQVTPMAALSSVLPRGRGTLEPVTRLVANLLSEGADWAPHPSVWAVAMDYDNGQRVPFGRPGSPAARLPDAVTASCSIPGWYTPVRIGEHRYVDGGTCSSTSLDLLADQSLDEIYVFAPMVSFGYDRPTSVPALLERRFRRLATRRLLREAAKVRAAGTMVRMFGPGAEDLISIGANMMDPRRRQQVLETSLQTSARALAADETAERDFGAAS